MLGAKERALLLALSETEYCTSGTLAKALGVSSKTAQGMVKDLREKLQKNGADILARTRHGYLLQVNDRALFETLSSGENAAAHFIPSGSEERIHYLLVLLLGQVDYVKLDDVSEELYVSKYTISGDLHQVEEENWPSIICQSCGVRIMASALLAERSISATARHTCWPITTI